jgi:mannose-6-phosphate isomerase-like protein (cupin superfamily)
LLFNEKEKRNVATVIGPNDGKAGSLGSIGVRLMADGAATGGGFSLVEHPMPPRALAAPLHRHTHEDEYSYVLEGRMGALLGDEVLEAGPGDLVFKPRNQWHTFWNAGDEPRDHLAGGLRAVLRRAGRARWQPRRGGTRPRRPGAALRAGGPARQHPRPARALRGQDRRLAAGGGRRRVSYARTRDRRHPRRGVRRRAGHAAREGRAAVIVASVAARR